MEMNTRLQVEHPVTEMITGLDLVEWQLRVAAGEALPLAAGGIALQGHAIEARVYAEDPERGFLPAAGRLVHLVFPQQDEHLRIDSGVDAGDEVSPHYDPMIAKVIAWDEDRDRARTRLLDALGRCHVVGVTSNVDFLTRLVASPAFAAAELDTGLIEREYAALFPPEGQQAVPEEVWLTAALFDLLRERQDAGTCSRRDSSSDPHSPWQLRDAWRLNHAVRRELGFSLGNLRMAVSVSVVASGFLLGLGSGSWPVQGELGAEGEITVHLSDRRFRARVIAMGDKRHIFAKGGHYVLTAVDAWQETGAADPHTGRLTSPMPGRIIALPATTGALVAQGTPLLVLEAMKMEHTLTAPARGRVNAYRCALGDLVVEGVELIDFQAED